MPLPPPQPFTGPGYYRPGDRPDLPGRYRPRRARRRPRWVLPVACAGVLLVVLAVAVLAIDFR